MKNQIKVVLGIIVIVIVFLLMHFVFYDKYNCADVFNKIQSEFSQKNIGYKQLIISYIQELLIKIIRGHSMLSRDNIYLSNNENTHFELEKIFLNLVLSKLI